MYTSLVRKLKILKNESKCKKKSEDRDWNLEKGSFTKKRSTLPASWSYSN